MYSYRLVSLEIAVLKINTVCMHISLRVKLGLGYRFHMFYSCPVLIIICLGEKNEVKNIYCFSNQRFLQRLTGNINIFPFRPTNV